MYRPFEFFVGLRYTRAKRRNHFISFISASSMLGIMLGIVALITVLSVMNGFHKEVRERILGMASHANIVAADNRLEDWRRLAQQVEHQPHVLGAAPFVEVQAMLVNGENVSGALLRGVLPEEEPKVADILPAMKLGRLESLSDGEFNIILGKELTQVLGARVGDLITVVTPEVSFTPTGMVPRLKRFTLTGIFEVGMGEYDRSVAFIHLGDGAKLLRLGDRVSGLRLKFDDMFLAPQLARQIALELPGFYRVRDWTQQHRNFFSALKTEKRMMGLILSLIVAVAAFNIVSALVMVVTDKQGDIAILRTLGASPLSIMAIFIIQGATIGLFGTLLGILGGVALALNTEALVAWIERTFNVDFLDPNIYYISRLPSNLHWDDVGLVAGTAFILTLVATLYPAWRAARTQPAEALRYE